VNTLKRDKVNLDICLHDSANNHHPLVYPLLPSTVKPSRLRSRPQSVEAATEESRIGMINCPVLAGGNAAPI
jgi:hypothetical protein